MDKDLYGEQPQREEGAKRRIRAGMAEQREPQTNSALPGSSLTEGRLRTFFYTANSRSEKKAQSAGFELAWRSGGSRRQTQPFPGARSRRTVCGQGPIRRTAAARRRRKAPDSSWHGGAEGAADKLSPSRELAHGGTFTDVLLYGEQPQREEGAKRRIRAGMVEQREPQTNSALPAALPTKRRLRTFF